MKRLFQFLLLPLLFVGCKDKPPVDEGVTSYTIVSKFNFASMGYSIDCYMYEYDVDDNRLDSNIIEQPEYKKEYTFYPADNVDHVKVKLRSAENTERWSGKIFFLPKGENTYINVNIGMLTDPAIFSLTEPML